MTITHVNHKGEPIDFSKPVHKKPKRATATPEPRAMGFRVVGHREGAEDEARRLANDEFARGGKPWDLLAWLRKTKRERISGRNFELREAADTFAELARKDGWEHVEVQEATRGDVEGARQRLAGF